ncbi:hypothetical protein [Emticicia fontis]
MIKQYTLFLFTIFLTLSSLRLSASPQRPDYIIYKGDTIVTYNLILEMYFQKQEKPDQGKLFGLSFRDGSSSSCWRGYQAIYQIDHDSLFLVDIINCGEGKNGKINKAASIGRIKEIFNDRMLNNRVYINWFSGDISFPLSNKVLRWDGVFHTIYEKEKVFSISAGKVQTIQDVENYVDDPKRIDRKYRSKISDTLFYALKKAKWRNGKDFDCSDRYVVTINENGRISKVKMLYEDNEIDEYYERDQYNFCIRKIYRALKSLKFDIIKDKGKPIVENIYIEIWIEDDGKIENWTR